MPNTPETPIVVPPHAALVFPKGPLAAQEYASAVEAHHTWARSLPDHSSPIPTVQVRTVIPPSTSVLKRHPHWPTKMHEFIESRKMMPFAWGQHDCGLFVCDHVAAMTVGAVDMAASVRGKYSDALGSAKAMAKACGSASLEDFAAWAAQQHGAVELANPLFAQRGDVILRDTADGVALGYVHLNGLHSLHVSDKGMAALPIFNKATRKATIRRAWRIR